MHTLIVTYIVVNVIIAIITIMILLDKPVMVIHKVLAVVLALLFGSFIFLNRVFLFLGGED